MRRLLLGCLVAALGVTAEAQRVQVENLPAHVIVDSCSGCGGGGAGSTIGAAVPSTATAIGVKDALGNLQYPQVDGSGNLLVAVTGAGSGGTSSTDGAVYTAGTTAGTAIIAARDDTTPTQIAEDKLGIVRQTPFRGLHINLRNALGAEIGVSGSALVVDGSAVTQPVSVASIPSHAVTNAGTFAVQAAQSGTWNVTNVSGTVSLPTGAATAAKQPALGTAGVASADVITVQGIASMTALKVDGSAVTQPVSGTVTANQGGTWTVQPGNTANTTAWKVDGSAVTQPVSGTVSITANSAVNVAQVNGVTVTTGAGATGTGVQRINGVSESATGAAPPAAAAYVGGLASGATGGFLAGITICDLSKPISITSATTTLLITGVSGRQVRICSMHLVTAIANNVALIEGTGATCGTGTAGLAGGTTAANGYNFAANGGIAIGSGLGEVITTATTGDSVCAITSAAGPLAGFIKYTIF